MQILVRNEQDRTVTIGNADFAWKLQRISQSVFSTQLGICTRERLARLAFLLLAHIGLVAAEEYIEGWGSASVSLYFFAHQLHRLQKVRGGSAPKAMYECCIFPILFSSLLWSDLAQLGLVLLWRLNAASLI